MGVRLTNVQVDESVPDGEARGYRYDGVQVCVVTLAPTFEVVEMAEGEPIRWVVSPLHKRRLDMMVTLEMSGFPVEGRA